MTMRAVTVAWLCVLCVAALPVPPASAADVVKIKPRDGVYLKMLVEVPDGAKALAMLFPGGAGKVKIKNDGTIRGTKGNFLTRSRDLFAAGGVAWALIDAPSDHMDKKGLTFDYRMTGEHAEDIRKAIAKLRKSYPGLPLWLVGTSRGSTSAANAAANIDDERPDGVVLTSSVGISNKHGGNLLDFKLGQITMPALVVHHNGDLCAVTPLSGAKDIAARLTGSKRTELMVFDGGERGDGNECGAKSHHGFLGIEQKAVDAITAWIKSH